MWIVLALLAAICATFIVLLSKAGLRNVSPNLAFAVEVVMIVAASWGTVLWQGLPAIGRVERRNWFVLAAAGLPTATSSLLAFRALSLGDASRVSPPIYPWHLRWFWQRYFQEKSLPGRSWAGALLMTAGALPIATAKPTKQPDAGNKNGRSETEATIYKTKPRA